MYKFLRIAQLCYEISNDGTGRQAFLDYSPHVNGINVGYYAEGFDKQDAGLPKRLVAYMDKDIDGYTVDGIIEFLEGLKNV